MRAMTDASSAAGLPWKSWTPQRQLVDALEQHRQPVGRGDRDDERVEPGLERLVAQQPRARTPCTVWTHSSSKPRSSSSSTPVRRASAAASDERQREDLLGGQAARGGEPGVARDERARLAGPGAAHDEERTAAMCGHLALRGGEAVERRARS